MTWVRIDDNMPQHPAMLAAGPAAAWLHISAICYSARYLTDGKIPTEALATLGVKSAPTLAKRLVDGGQWIEVDGGWEIPAFLEFNPSREEVLERRERDTGSKAAAGSLGNHRRWHVAKGRTNPTCEHCIADASQNDRTEIAASDTGVIAPTRPLLAAAAAIVADRRGKPIAATTKDDPGAWLASAVRGIEAECAAALRPDDTAEQLADRVQPPGIVPASAPPRPKADPACPDCEGHGQYIPAGDNAAVRCPCARPHLEVVGS